MNKEKEKKIISIYSYTDPNGKELYQVVRFEPKDFRVRHRAQNRHWVWKAPEVKVPYRLDLLAAAKLMETVVVVEGEKDVDRLTALGFIATTNQGGTGNTKSWEVFAEHFNSRTVVIIPDNDDVGRKHAERVEAILKKEAAIVTTLHLGGLEPKGDVSDWLALKGNTEEKLKRLINEAISRELTKSSKIEEEPRIDFSRGDAWEPPSVETSDFEEYETGWVPFPLQVLPYAMRQYANEIANSIKVDPSYVALPSLIMAAGTIGNSRVIRLNKTWTEPSVLFGALLADPSTRKSPAMNWAALPVTEMDYELAVGYKALFERWATQNKSWAAENGNVDEVGQGDEKKTRPAKPKKDRLVISDITVETIVRELENNPRGLIMIRDELRAWFASFGRYKSGSSGGGDLGFWLEAYRASAYIYDRKSGDQTSVLVPHCAVSVYGTIQPAVIARIFCREYFESGFVSRMLLALPPKRPGSWDRHEPSDETIEMYRLLFRRLRGLRGGFSPADECNPVEVLMSKEAEAAWGEWYNKWQKAQFDSEGEVAAMLSKLEGQCARFALIFAVCEQAMGENDDGLIEERHIKSAITLAEWFAHEAQRVYAFCGKTENEVDQDRVIEKVENNGKYITARELFLTNKPKFKNTENAKNILARLCESGKLREVDHIPGRVNTRRTTYFTTILR